MFFFYRNPTLNPGPNRHLQTRASDELKMKSKIVLCVWLLLIRNALVAVAEVGLKWETRDKILTQILSSKIERATHNQGQVYQGRMSKITLKLYQCLLSTLPTTNTAYISYSKDNKWVHEAKTVTLSKNKGIDFLKSCQFSYLAF